MKRKTRAIKSAPKPGRLAREEIKAAILKVKQAQVIEPPEFNTIFRDNMFEILS